MKKTDEQITEEFRNWYTEYRVSFIEQLQECTANKNFEEATRIIDLIDELDEIQIIGFGDNLIYLLKKAIKIQDYEEAARLRDLINNKLT